MACGLSSRNQSNRVPQEFCRKRSFTYCLPLTSKRSPPKKKIASTTPPAPLLTPINARSGTTYLSCSDTLVDRPQLVPSFVVFSLCPSLVTRISYCPKSFELASRVFQQVW